MQSFRGIMRVYTAPEILDFPIKERLSIFLAGSIEQDKAQQWQQQVIGQLSHLRVAIFNPRRHAWNASLEQSTANRDFVDQVNWELDRISSTDVVFFYFQPGTQSPISLAELGLVLGRNQQAKLQEVFVVCPNGFWRKGNVDIMAQCGDFRLYEKLSDGISALSLFVEEKMCNGFS